MFFLNIDFGSADFSTLYSECQEFSPLRLGWKGICRKEYIRGPEYAQRNSKYFHVTPVSFYPKCYSQWNLSTYD